MHPCPLQSAGAAIAVFEGVGERNSAAGLVLCSLGTVSNGLMMSFSGRVMSEKVDALRLTFYTSPIACLILMPFYMRLEAGPLRAYRSQAQASYLGARVLSQVRGLRGGRARGSCVKVCCIRAEPGEGGKSSWGGGNPPHTFSTNPHNPTPLTSSLCTIYIVRPPAADMRGRPPIQPDARTDHPRHQCRDHHRGRGAEDHLDPAAVGCASR